MFRRGARGTRLTFKKQEIEKNLQNGQKLSRNSSTSAAAVRTSVQPSPVPSSGIHTALSAEHTEPPSPQYGAPRPLTILRTGHRDPHSPHY